MQTNMKPTNTSAQGMAHAAVIAGLMVFGAMIVNAGLVTVTNVTAAQRTDEAVVDISYDLLNPSGGAHLVTIDISTNGGAAYFSTCTNFSGAIGAGMATGVHQQVVWDAAGDLPEVSGVMARVRVTAFNDMALIPAGAFTMGNCMTNTEGDSDEFPTHSVYISAFYMDKYEVTKAKWDEVYTWATGHGYSFSHTGSVKAVNHPVHTVNWYDCVKWCNARSELEGRTPCYYLDAAQTVVYRSGESNIWNGAVNWSANGYRLPTEAEWEKAARGGAAGHRFPWSDVDWIDFTRANYRSYWCISQSDSYDHESQSGYHPLFAVGGEPYTSPVGYFAANGYGLYDMAGNVSEWCWDWFDGHWYSNAGATQDDPCGPDAGSYRVLRGGSWEYKSFSGPYGCRVACRSGADIPGEWIFTFDYGFRAVRR